METGKRERKSMRSRNPEKRGRGPGGHWLRDGKTQIQSERATESHEEEGPKHQQTKR